MNESDTNSIHVPMTSSELKQAETKSKNMKDKNTIALYVFFTVVFTVIIGVFSLIMSSIADYRNNLAYDTYTGVEKIYNGPLAQSAPSLGVISEDSSLYRESNLSYFMAQRFVENTTLKSTDAEVNMEADFVKKGLVYQPTYRTEFKSTYVLKNDLNEESLITFQFPFPVNIDYQEISEARLTVDGVEVQNAKSKINTASPTPTASFRTDPYYYPVPIDNLIDGLKWEGKIPAGQEVVVEVSYETVGLSSFSYQGLSNSKGAQDFNFKVNILGTRSYDVLEGLSVTSREFGDNSVSLMWEKPDLYSTPNIQVAIGDKLNPSAQVSRVYLTMAPVYFVFIVILLYLAYRFAKKKLSIFDMLLVTILFIIYFPFVHYLSSFTIDPTIEVFSNFSNVPQFSMPIYGAFGIAATLIGGLMYYFLGRIGGFRFSTKFAIPEMVLAFGFFPLVVTIPEYSMLLVIIGVIALMAIIVQVRVRMVKEEEMPSK